jgi:hypothetical protein
LVVLSFMVAAGKLYAGADDAASASAPAAASPVDTAELAVPTPTVSLAPLEPDGQDPGALPAKTAAGPDPTDEDPAVDATVAMLPPIATKAELATPNAAIVATPASNAEAAAPDELAPTTGANDTDPTPAGSPAALGEAVVTPTPTSTEPPHAELSAGVTRFADPGEIVRYEHLITAGTSGVVDVVATSSAGWVVVLLGTDAAGPLSDHDGDGLPDTGPLPPGETRRIAVEVTVPVAALAGTQDVTTLTVGLGGAGRAQVATASDATTVNPVLTLTIESADVTFGRVTAAGEVAPAIQGVVGVADALGAYYVREGAVRVTVVSNGPWAGSCRANDDVANGGSILVAEGRLEWRLAGTTSWTAFVPGVPTAPYDGACFPHTETGATTFVYDLRLRVETGDAAGPFDAEIAFEASPMAAPSSSAPDDTD